MITSKELQNRYVNLYKGLREYIWPYKIVCHIADLETSVYRSFPDMDEVQRNLTKLKTSCFEVIRDDEDLQTAFDEFQEVIDSADNMYSKLDTRLEGVA